MSKREKREFIRQNRQLPLQDLASQTGLKQSQVQQILDGLGPEDLSTVSSIPGRGPNSLRWAPWIALLPVLAVFFVYFPSLHNGFVNFDDQEYILSNSPLRYWNSASFHWMLTTFHAGYWMPLTWLSYSLDWRLGGGDPFFFHLDSLLWHCLNTALVFGVGVKILNLASNAGPGKTIPAALLASLLFGLHPLHVESVAWASERKDVLCAAFFLASLLAYLNRGLSGDKNRWFYASLGFFALALLCKPMAVTLPAVLLILDAWPLRRLPHRWAGALMERIPFIILSLAASILVLLTQSKQGALMTLEKYPLDFRLANAFHSIVFYLKKMVAPTELSVLYPITMDLRILTPQTTTAFLLGIGITLVVLLQRKKRPYLAVAWACYIVTLLPVLGLFQAGSQAAADRYTYLSSLGPFLLFSAFLAFVFSRRLVWLALPALGLCAILARLTMAQTDVWADSIRLWENAVRTSAAGSQVARSHLGEAFREAGRFPEALQAYNLALESGPPDAVPLNGRGIVLFEMGRPDYALQDFKTAMILKPDYPTTYHNLWIANQKLGKVAESLVAAKSAVRLEPQSARAWDMLGISRAGLDKFEESLEALGKALALEPESPEFLRHLSVIKTRQANPKQSLADFQKALMGN